MKDRNGERILSPNFLSLTYPTTRRDNIRSPFIKRKRHGREVSENDRYTRSSLVILALFPTASLSLRSFSHSIPFLPEGPRRGPEAVSVASGGNGMEWGPDDVTEEPAKRPVRAGSHIIRPSHSHPPPLIPYGHSRRWVPFHPKGRPLAG